MTFGGIESPLAKVISDSPSNSRKGDSPRIPQKPLPKLPSAPQEESRPMIIPPPPKSRGKTSSPQTEAYNQSVGSYTEPTENQADTTDPYSQSAHSYLELLPDASPKEIAAAKNMKAPGSTKPGSKMKSPQKPSGSSKPGSSSMDTGGSNSGGANVKQKAKALDNKFKLTNNPTLGRQKATDAKNASVMAKDKHKE